jgi:hypothetical protein
MKKLSLLFIVLSVLFASCDDKDPSITFLDQNEQTLASSSVDVQLDFTASFPALACKIYIYDNKELENVRVYEVVNDGSVQDITADLSITESNLGSGIMKSIFYVAHKGIESPKYKKTYEAGDVIKLSVEATDNNQNIKTASLLINVK